MYYTQIVSELLKDNTFEQIRQFKPLQAVN